MVKHPVDVVAAAVVDVVVVNPQGRPQHLGPAPPWISRDTGCH
jgi:hypothetical protein